MASANIRGKHDLERRATVYPRVHPLHLIYPPHFSNPPHIRNHQKITYSDASSNQWKLKTSPRATKMRASPNRRAAATAPRCNGKSCLLRDSEYRDRTGLAARASPRIPISYFLKDTPSSLARAACALPRDRLDSRMRRIPVRLHPRSMAQREMGRSPIPVRVRISRRGRVLVVGRLDDRLFQAARARVRRRHRVRDDFRIGAGPDDRRGAGATG